MVLPNHQGAYILHCVSLSINNFHNQFLSLHFTFPLPGFVVWYYLLGQYVQAFRMQPENPLHSLCVGLTFFHMASQKFVIKRHSLVMQVCSWPMHRRADGYDFRKKIQIWIQMRNIVLESVNYIVHRLYYLSKILSTHSCAMHSGILSLMEKCSICPQLSERHPNMTVAVIAICKTL